MISIHHKVNAALVALAPVTLLAGAAQTPFDLLLCFALPVHSHIGMNLVITDYAKKLGGKGAIAPARKALAVVTGLSALGLLKLTMAGPGITESVKSFWRPKA